MITYPELNLDLLIDLIDWAEADTHSDQSRRLTGWGRWAQSYWSWTEAKTGDNPEDSDGIDISMRARNGACRTAYCIAGQAVHQSKYRLLYNEEDSISNGVTIPVWTATECIAIRPTREKDAKGHVVWADVPGAEPEDLSDVAARVLGLTDDEAHALFLGSNTLDHLKGLVYGFLASRGEESIYPGLDVLDPREHVPSF